MRHWRASDASLLQHWARVPPTQPPGGYLGILEGILRVCSSNLVCSNLVCPRPHLSCPAYASAAVPSTCWMPGVLSVWENGQGPAAEILCLSVRCHVTPRVSPPLLLSCVPVVHAGTLLLIEPARCLVRLRPAPAALHAPLRPAAAAAAGLATCAQVHS